MVKIFLSCYQYNQLIYQLKLIKLKSSSQLRNGILELLVPYVFGYVNGLSICNWSTCSFQEKILDILVEICSESWKVSALVILCLENSGGLTHKSIQFSQNAPISALKGCLAGHVGGGVDYCFSQVGLIKHTHKKRQAITYLFWYHLHLPYGTLMAYFDHRYFSYLHHSSRRMIEEDVKDVEQGVWLICWEKLCDRLSNANLIVT